MTSDQNRNPFYVVPDPFKHVLMSATSEIVKAVRRAYELQTAIAQTVNPDSYFLKFPEKPSARIIALPAYIGGEIDRAGLKWISSFPENRLMQLARASGILVLE